MVELNVELEVSGMTQYPTDKTLSIRDMAADAKSTGDAIREIQEKINTDVVTKSEDIIDDLATDDSTKALSAAQGKALYDKLVASKQISDDNAFENKTEMFYDWAGYLNTKTGAGVNYISGVRIPVGDPAHVKLIMYNDAGVDYLYDINTYNNTITYLGSLSSDIVKYWKIDNLTTDASGDIDITSLTANLGNQLYIYNIVSVTVYAPRTTAICSYIHSYANWAYVKILDSNFNGQPIANEPVSIIIGYQK